MVVITVLFCPFLLQNRIKLEYDINHGSLMQAFQCLYKIMFIMFF